MPLLFHYEEYNESARLHEKRQRGGIVSFYFGIQALPHFELKVYLPQQKPSEKH